MTEITKVEYDLLCRIRRGEPFADNDMDVARLLMHKRLIAHDASWNLRVTPLGLSAMLQYEDTLSKAREQSEEKAAEDAKNDRVRRDDVRRSWWQFFLGLFLGWILGGVTFSEFVGWASVIFSKLIALF